MQKLLRLNDVKAATGLGRTSLYDLMARGEFPRPVPLSARARGWLESEVRAWQDSRVASRDRRQTGRA